MHYESEGWGFVYIRLACVRPRDLLYLFMFVLRDMGARYSIAP
jgi:hypothetical protein